MTYPKARDDADNISVASHSSRISYEVDPCLVFEELSKQADDYSSDEESEESENEIGLPAHHCPTDFDDGLLDREINTVGHRLKETINRVTSDLSLCSLLEEEEVQFDSPPTRPTPRRSSVLSLLQKRIIDREVKKGKIVRTRSMVELSNNQSEPIRRVGSAFSFKTLLNSCEAIVEEIEVPIEVSTEVKCNQIECLDGDTAPQDITMMKRRRSADPLLMASVVMEAALSESTAQRRSSAILPSEDDGQKYQLPSFESVIKGFREFQGDMNNKARLRNKSSGMDELTLDTDEMSGSEFF